MGAPHRAGALHRGQGGFLSATEDVARTTVDYYFTLLMSQANVEIAAQNLENAGQLYAVAQEKRRMGQISKTTCCRWN